MFPAPLEGDRYLYKHDPRYGQTTKFPAPREVVRHLYIYIIVLLGGVEIFPAPLEVDRYLYTIILLNKLKTFCFRPLAR